ncbi:MAG TPA: hypothetical protein PK397_00650 [Ignavibacteriaceae bacterium]|jgi:hypothetical protein|nr:hypothetical protein [Ignavibacteriaceae bacterium]
MKIAENSIGNYNIVRTAMVNQSPKIVAENTVSKEEKAFFSGLYPGNKDTIMDYHFYQRSGKMSGVSIGSIFDRRG